MGKRIIPEKKLLKKIYLRYSSYSSYKMILAI